MEHGLGFFLLDQTFPGRVEQQKYGLFMTCHSVRSQQVQTLPQKHGYPRNPIFEPDLLSGVQGPVGVPPSPLPPPPPPRPRSCRWGCCGPTAAREVLQAGLWEAQDGGSNHHNPGFFPIWGAVPLPSHPTPAGVTWRYLFLSKTASHRGSWFLP